MRGIFERMRQETKAKSDRLYLIDNTPLDLSQPLPELLYQVYDVTLNQHLPGFASIESYVFPNFEVLSSAQLSLEQRRGLCLFLQESLVNVGKYAIGATRIDVICKVEARQYRLQIIDNGPAVSGADSIAQGLPVGQGTRQARRLARQLKGTFRRTSNRQVPSEKIFSSGLRCELTWPKQRAR